MQDKLALGRNEMDISNEAAIEASRMMVAALGPAYQPLAVSLGAPPAQVVYSAGANTAMPHGLPGAHGLRRGDVLVTYAGSSVAGYQSELERTMIVGEPTAEFAKYFNLMLTLQQVAFDSLRPGRQLAEVETEVSNAFAELDIAELQRHHTGHGIGLEGHEAPFIDKGDPTVIVPGMVLSVEPGLYVPGLAGFRHSDTVVITETGCERLTYYPRDLANLTVPL
jgi:Xaa-Pro aminopeptidase